MAMVVSRFIVTVDGGGSNTSMALWARSGHMLSRAQGPACNIYRDAEAGFEVIEDLWLEVRSVVGLHPIKERDQATISLGLAGAGLPSARQLVREQFSGFADCLVSGDGYASLIGAFGGGAGAILSVGTGVVGCRIDHKGVYQQLGGWGFPVGDRGGGAWLGMQLIADYLQMRDGAGLIEDSGLWSIVEEKIGKNKPEVLLWLQKAQPADFAELAPFIVEAASHEDEEAVDLIHYAIDEIRRLSVPLIGDPPLPLQITGSLGRALRPWLSLQEADARASPHRGALLIGLGEVAAEFED